MRLMNVAAAAAQQRPPFGPLSIGWHSAGWTEGPEFVALGYSDSDAVTNWPNEVVAERDLTSVGSTVTYVASSANMNSKPAVSFGTSTAGIRMASDFVSAPTYPISVVLIARRGASGGVLFEGSNTGRNMIYSVSNVQWRIFAGTERGESTNTADDSIHLFVATFDGSTGNDTLTVDGSLRVNADAGSGQIPRVTIGNRYDFFADGSEGEFSFWGVYEGDVSADPLWADFETWAASHYGLTIA